MNHDYHCSHPVLNDVALAGEGEGAEVPARGLHLLQHGVHRVRGAEVALGVGAVDVAGRGEAGHQQQVGGLAAPHRAARLLPRQHPLHRGRLRRAPHLPSRHAHLDVDSAGARGAHHGLQLVDGGGVVDSPLELSAKIRN